MPRAQELTMLVDASSLIYRAFFAVPDTVRAPDGRPVNGPYGFINMLARLIADHGPTYLACATDEDWRPQWRVDLLDSYKLHRVAEQDAEPDPVEPQIALTVEILELAGIPVLGCPDFEAEDVIGTLAARAPGPVAIVSGDRDLFQLVRDPDHWVLFPVRGVSELSKVDGSYIAQKYSIPPDRYADYAVLRGDPSDGLPGVRGIGDKTASALVTKYGSIDAIVTAARADRSGPLGKVAAQLDYVERAVQVVRIPSDAPVAEMDLRIGARAPDERLAERAKELALNGPVERLLQALLDRTR